MMQQQPMSYTTNDLMCNGMVGDFGSAPKLATRRIEELLCAENVGSGKEYGHSDSIESTTDRCSY
jgi:hypothetical protein